MKNPIERRQNRQTLKQYLTSNSLRKKAMSKGHSREGSCVQDSTIRHYHHDKNCKGQSTGRQSCSMPSRKELVEQFKVKLAELITDDGHLTVLLRLFDRLIELYNSQLSQHFKENQMMMSMMKQSQVIEHKSPTNRSRESRFQKQSMVDFQNADIFEQPYSQLQGTHNGFPKHTPQHRRIQSHDSTIPNINLLMMTNSIGKHQKYRPQTSQQTYQETKQTQANGSQDVRKSSEEFIGDTFRNTNQSNVNSRGRRGSANSNMSNFLTPGLFGKDQDPSQVRVSLRSSLWNNMDMRGNRNRLVEQQFRHRQEAPFG